MEPPKRHSYSIFVGSLDPNYFIGCLFSLVGQYLSAESLVESIGHLFNLRALLPLHFHLDKCMLFSSEVRWCGRIISSDGWRFEPANIDTLCKMQPPQTGSQLQQIFCVLRWVPTTLPDFLV